MITVKDHSTGHLFDLWDHMSPKRRKLLDTGWPGVFRKYLLEKLPVAKIVRYFTEDMGRPSKELNTAIGVLILQQLQDISDDKVRDELAFNIAWHYALDITDASDASMYISERTVRKYRQMLIKEGLDQILFNTLTDAHKGQGFQVQIMETYQPEKQDDKIPNLITHVEVEPAHIHDTHALQPAIDDTAQRDCCPDELLCDTLYGSDDNVQEAQEKGVEVIAPIHGPAPKEGISLADFTYNPATQYVIHCPEGHDPKKTCRTKKNRLCATFPRETCLTCSRRTDCPVQLGKKAAYLHYDDAMLRHAQRRAHEQTPEFRHKFRWRSGIEGTNSHLKSDVGAARLRVRGLPAVRFAVTLKALGLNILRCARALAARFLIRIARLCLKKQLVKHEFSVVTSFALFSFENSGFYLVA